MVEIRLILLEELLAPRIVRVVPELVWMFSEPDLLQVVLLLTLRS